MPTDVTPELKTAYEHLPASIAVIEPENLRVMWLNDHARTSLGYAAEIPPMLDLAGIITGATAEELVTKAQGLRGEVSQYCQLKAADNAEHPAEIQLTRLTHAGDDVLVLHARDLTETVELTEALNRARMYLESAPDPTVVVDHTGAIVTSNAQVESLLGYRQAELQGYPVERLLPARYKHTHVAHRQSYTRTPVIRGMGAGLNLFALAKDGREIPIEVSLSPIVSAGKTLVAAALRDMTERKAAEQALLKSEESLREARDQAETATAGKTRFLAAASHDLRQPLQALRLYLSVLNRRAQETKDREVIVKMESSVDTMSDLLDALLDISRLNSGAITPSRSDFSTLALFENIIASNLEQAKEKGLSLQCAPGDYKVHSDPGLLARIVDNYVTNAIRYTPTGHISLAAEQSEEGIVISVTDTGIGIEADQINQIFEEYFQLDNSVRDRKKGLGLGLSIVKHIATLLNHEIGVTSVVNQGSVFSVTVPSAEHQIRRTSESALINNSPQIEDKKTARVLLVDDDEAIVDATRMFLEDADMEVAVAYDGNEAIELLQKKPRFNLLITDYRLPGMNGVEVIEQARAIYGAPLAAVLMSGDTTSSELPQITQEPCERLRKPVDTDALIRLIRKLTR